MKKSKGKSYRALIIADTILIVFFALLSILFLSTGDPSGRFFLVMTIIFIGLSIFVPVSYKHNLKTSQAYADRINGSFSTHQFKSIKRLIGTWPQIYIDDEHKKWAVVKDINSSPAYYDYKDIIQFEVFQDGGSVMKGRTGSALIGGLTWGILGATISAAGQRVIPACTSLQIIITVNNLSEPKITIPLVSRETNKNSSQYKNAVAYAKEVTSTLAYMQNKVKLQSTSSM